MEARKPDLIGIGAGPANLFMFIQAKLHNPAKEIIIFEKYEAYQRSHHLEIDPKSYYGTHPDPAFQELIKSFDSKIRTNDLEAKLKAFAEKIGILIVYSEVKDCEALAAEFPEAKRIISASGARGITRRQIFNDELRDQESLQHIAEIKYSAQGTTYPFNTVFQYIPVSCHVKHFTIEHVGHKGEDGTTPVTVRFFISKDEFEAMKEARGKTSYKLSGDDPIPPMLRATIENWLIARAGIKNETRVEDSERITVTELGIYCAKEFVKTAHGKEWLLLGDEKFGVPFFRSLNNAFLCATQMAVAVAFDQPLDKYLAFAENLATTQIKLARQKSQGIHVLEKSREIASGKLPWVGTTKAGVVAVSIFTPTIGIDVKRNMRARNAAAQAAVLPDNYEDDSSLESTKDTSPQSQKCLVM
jgi:hypothetical protein